MSELSSLGHALELDKVAPFLIKLFEIVSSPASDYLIGWSEMGDSFRIIDRTKFAQVRERNTIASIASMHSRSSRVRAAFLRALSSTHAAHVRLSHLCMNGRMCCRCTSSTTTCGPSSGN